MQTKTVKPVLLTILGLLLFCSSPGAGAAKDYNIEVIIFRYSGTDHFNNEHWPDTWHIPDMTDSLDLRKIPWKEKERFTNLTAKERTLDRLVESLKDSRRYDVLTHIGWRQPGLNKDDAIDIKIQSGQAYRRLTPEPAPLPGDEQQTGTAKPETGSLFVLQEHDDADIAGQNRAVTVEYEKIDRVPDNDTGNVVYELSGNFKVVISRFIHVYADLLLMQPVTLKLEQPRETPDIYTPTDSETLIEKPSYRLVYSNPDLEFTTLHGFNIREHRRMRSDELHYIDHPLLGIIVKAWSAPD